MSLWKRIEEWFNKNSTQLIVAEFPDPPGGPAVKPHEVYFGIWLSHVFLAKEVSWLTHNYPAAHVSVDLKVAGENLTLTRMAGPPEDLVGPGVWTDFPVTGAVPYGGGTIELEAGLTALQRSSFLGAAIGVVGELSSLVGPPLSEAIPIVGKLANGVQKVLDEGAGDIVLGLHSGFAEPGGGGQNALSPGYLAVVRASERDLDRTALSVLDSRLHIANANGTRPLEGFDYMLFRVDCTAERGDWRFANIEDLIRKAIGAHFAGEQEAFEGFRNAVLAEILSSPDLTRPDRNRVALAVRDEIESAISLGRGAVGEPAASLEGIVQRHAIPSDDPAAQHDLSLAELIAQP